MVRVADLNIREEVLPFFNFTNNEFAGDHLLHLLLTKPATLPEVIARQETLRGILANWEVLESFTYRKLDYLEVRAHLMAIANSTFTIGDGFLNVQVKLLLFESDRNRLRSKLVQLVLFLENLWKYYLFRLDKEKFPASFRDQLHQAWAFLNRLDLPRVSSYLTEDKFSVARMVAFLQRLHQLDPNEIHAFWDFLADLEAYWSVARAAVTHGLVFPSFSPDTFSLENFYHPAVKIPVTNSLAFGEGQNLLLLTGPNMSGKSTLLKALGLCVYLAHAGFPMPASAGQIPFFQSLAIAINLGDDLQSGYSHFQSEIENLKAVLTATKGEHPCFAVFDEIFKGTNPEDALDITRTTVRGLSRIKGSYFFISTHLSQLNEELRANPQPGVKKGFIDCVLENGTPRFSFKLREGFSDLKIGRILFEKAGLADMLGESKFAI